MSEKGLRGASGLVSGIPFHMKHAKSIGASREEVIVQCLSSFPLWDTG